MSLTQVANSSITIGGEGSNITTLSANTLGVGTSNPTYPLHVVGDARIQGNLTVNGTQTIIDTNVATTERLDITNDGTGPALRVTQLGAQPIADFYDDGNVLALRIADGGNVGIGMSTPSRSLAFAPSATGISLHNPNPTINPSPTSNAIWFYDNETYPAKITGGHWTNYGSFLDLHANTSNPSMRIINGNVGVGTSNPQGKLHVSQNVKQSPALTGDMNTGVIISALAGSETINIGCGTGYNWIHSAYINNSGVSAPLSLQPIGGYVGIGTSNPIRTFNVKGAWPCIVAGTNSTTNNVVVIGEYGGKAYFGAHANNLQAWADIWINDGGGAVYRGTNGNTSTFNVVSDRRLKENIVDADTNMCWDNIKRIPLKRFNFNSNIQPGFSNVQDINVLGVIAQDVQQVFPKAISVRNDEVSGITDLMSLQIDQILYCLYGAVQEAQKRIEQLESKLSTI